MNRTLSFRNTATLRRTLAALTVLVFLVVSVSCQDAVSDALGITSVNASDGEFKDRIAVSWSPVSKTDSAGNTIPLSEYEITRTGGAGTQTFTTSETSYTDTAVVPGVSYTYSVTAKFTDGGEIDVVLADTGYAMDALVLQIYSSAGDGVVNYDGTPDADWFNVLAQEGWTYVVTVTGGGSPTLYRIGSITTAVPASSAGNGVYTYRVPKSDTYHLRMSGADGTVSVHHD